MAVKRRKVVGQGKKRRTLLKGEYPLLPRGNFWFELVLETGYYDVQVEDEAAVQAALEGGFSAQETLPLPMSDLSEVVVQFGPVVRGEAPVEGAREAASEDAELTADDWEALWRAEEDQ